jgi:hypothetical protein
MPWPRWPRVRRTTTSVPGDLRGLSLIGLVEEHQESTRILKQGSREHEQTWKLLTTTRSIHSVFLNVLEEIRNWWTLGEGSRYGLLHWLHNYLAKRAGVSIYCSHRRWRPIPWGCAGGQKETRILVLGMGGFHRGSPPVITGHAFHDSPRRGLALKHMARNGDWSTAAKFISIDRWAWGYDKLSRDGTQVDPGVEIFTCPRLSTDHGARIVTINQQSRQRITSDEGEWTSDLIQFGVHCTMVSWVQTADRAICREICSQFQVVTRSSLLAKL